MTESRPCYNTPLTDAAQRLYEFICRHKAAHGGNSPTLREMAAGAGLASTSGIMANLRRLMAAGLVRMPAYGHARAVEVVGGQWTPPASLIAANAAADRGEDG